MLVLRGFDMNEENFESDEINFNIFDILPENYIAKNNPCYEYCLYYLFSNI